LLTLGNLAIANKLPSRIVLLLTLLVLALIGSTLHSGVPFERALFGQFGRGNGLLYYLLVIVIFGFAAKTYKNSSGGELQSILEIRSESDGVENEFLLQKLKKVAVTAFVRKKLDLTTERLPLEKYSLTLINTIKDKLVLKPADSLLFKYYSNLLVF
jgi:hypothetical protein